ncbi:MAG TPA: SET domain-containing protein-lysine N-methyltransferase [Ramlibacter sp.]|uniref:SET domain-containing protein n=1 Tax=Ramlibacter sp. TaxID=1917967 RepID=UPI002C396C54|nr:SET domain-containing protein-lysine N-methyltransferase [Ramlibacter sp.]HVZ46148.1 SET domain-containing protein-lysine N-methyltransferase [Ramlibacter sp.]
MDADFVFKAFTVTQRIAAALPTLFFRFDAEPGAIQPRVTDRTVQRRSTLPDAGNGLFCRRDIGKDEVISTVKGRKRSLFACFFFVRSFSHVFTLSPGFVLIPDRDDVVQLANHNFDDAAINAYFLREPSAACVKLVALRDLREGEEIFVKYHDRYLKSQTWARTILQTKQAQAR